jgi:hypothetical protein
MPTAAKDAYVVDEVFIFHCCGKDNGLRSEEKMVN